MVPTELKYPFKKGSVKTYRGLQELKKDFPNPPKGYYGCPKCCTVPDSESRAKGQTPITNGVEIDLNWYEGHKCGTCGTLFYIQNGT